MRLTRLDLTNYRGLRETHIEFDDRLTVITGENGVGKSSVLDATRTLITKLWRELGVYRGDTLDFDTDHDVTRGEEAMEARLAFVLNDQSCQFTAAERRRVVYENPEYEGGLTQKGKEEASIEVRDRKLLTADAEAVVAEVPDCSRKTLLRRGRPKPLALFYSSRRSLYEAEKPRSTVVENRAAAPFMRALRSRPLQLLELATWWASEAYIATLKTDRAAQAARTLAAMQMAALRAVDTLDGLDVRTKDPETGDDVSPTLVATKGGSELDVRWLSDGERSLLALALDITRRLAQNQPRLKNPVKNGEAVVLIDELDLHLHPSWQRRIPGVLTSTFERCQFICTSHSPQIVGEVPAEQVRRLSAGGGVDDASLAKGQDYNLILETVFGDEDRNPEAQALLDRIFRTLHQRGPDVDSAAVADEAEALIEEFEAKYLPKGSEIHRARARLERLRRLGR